jgi:hypothetical protein
MKMSEWLRRYQVSGEIPSDEGLPPEFAFWAGWLIGRAKQGTVRTYDEAREMAIKAAEFIEQCAGK